MQYKVDLTNSFSVNGPVTVQQYFRNTEILIIKLKRGELTHYKY